jgi:hypothetical protein
MMRRKSLPEQILPQLAIVIGGFKGQRDDIGLDALDRSHFTDLGMVFIVQRELDDQLISQLEIGNAVYRKPHAGLGDILNLDQSFYRVALAILKEKHPHQVHRFSKMTAAFHQHPIDVATAACAFKPHGRLKIGKAAQIPDDPLIARRADKRAFTVIVDKNPISRLARGWVSWCIRNAGVLIVWCHATIPRSFHSPALTGMYRQMHRRL